MWNAMFSVRKKTNDKNFLRKWRQAEQKLETFWCLKNKYENGVFKSTTIEINLETSSFQNVLFKEKK